MAWSLKLLRKFSISLCAHHNHILIKAKPAVTMQADQSILSPHLAFTCLQSGTSSTLAQKNCLSKSMPSLVAMFFLLGHQDNEAIV